MILRLNSSKVMQEKQLRKALTGVTSSWHIFHYMQQSPDEILCNVCVYLEHILHCHLNSSKVMQGMKLRKA